LLFFSISIFAVLGTMLFGTTKSGIQLSNQANFRSFPMSLVTLCQLLLGDDWFTMMVDCSILPPFCTDRFNGFKGSKVLSFGDCGNILSPLYFLVSTHEFCREIKSSSFEIPDI
jgi:hypothetical protein